MKLLYSRHSGARVSDDLSLKDMRLVVIENDALRLTVVPDKGADIVEFLDKRTFTDPLWRTFNGPRSPKSEPNYYGHDRFHHAYYEGGWQELFPHGSAPLEVNGITQPMHGEVLALPWKYAILEDHPERVEVKFWTRTPLSRFAIERTMTVDASDPVVHFSEKVTNCSGKSFDVMWGHHPAFGAPFLSADCTIELPPGKFLDGDNSMLQIAPPVPYRTSPNGNAPGNMFYLTDFPEGWYGIHNSRLNVGFGMRWDSRLFKVIWIWQSYDHPDTYACAIEPFTSLPQAHYDLAGRLPVPPGQTLSTEFDAFLYHGNLQNTLASIRKKG